MNGNSFAVGQAVQQGWLAIRRHPLEAIVGTLVLFAVNLAMGVLEQIPLIGIVFAIAGLFVQPALTGGQAILYLNVVNDNNPQIVNVFDGFKKYVEFLGVFWLWFVIGVICMIPAGIGAGAMTAVLMVCKARSTSSILAGVAVLLPFAICSLVLLILAGLRWLFVYQVVADGLNQGRVLEAFRVSSRLTEGHRLRLFLTMLVLGLVAIAGVLACCVGLLVTVPLAGCGVAWVYMQLRPRIAPPIPVVSEAGPPPPAAG